MHSGLRNDNAQPLSLSVITVAADRTEVIVRVLPDAQEPSMAAGGAVPSVPHVIVQKKSKKK